MALQTNAQLWQRFQFSGTKGGKHEQRVSLIAQDIMNVAVKAQTLIGDNADTVTLLANLDTFMSNLHTASSKLAN